MAARNWKMGNVEQWDTTEARSDSKLWCWTQLTLACRHLKRGSPTHSRLEKQAPILLWNERTQIICFPKWSSVQHRSLESLRASCVPLLHISHFRIVRRHQLMQEETLVLYSFQRWPIWVSVRKINCLLIWPQKKNCHYWKTIVILHVHVTWVDLCRILLTDPVQCTCIFLHMFSLG